ncbi:MAG: lysophospholipid acyltransferase family protein [Candidatus Aminicenantes bacterium]|nr:lysophospholipid acyltransferase family protein [Candidatus Aminicenantes bacterium]
MAFSGRLREAVIDVLGRPLFWTWFKLCRWTVSGEEDYRALRRAGKSVILIMWHSRIFIVPYFFRKRGVMPLVSPSRDGEIPARIMSRWGYKVLRGSSSHSVVKAWGVMTRELRAGGEVIIVPDGPRGPNRVLKEGCLKLAQQTGAAIVPFTFSASRPKTLRSWDRFLMFPPFSRVSAVFGRPFTVDPELSGEKLEKMRRAVEKILNDLDAAADSGTD